ncbi:hypothetical protein ACTXT7_009332 [Hymenolepis weldensis]
METQMKKVKTEEQPYLESKTYAHFHRGAKVQLKYTISTNKSFPAMKLENRLNKPLSSSRPLGDMFYMISQPPSFRRGLETIVKCLRFDDCLFANVFSSHTRSRKIVVVGVFLNKILDPNSTLILIGIELPKPSLCKSSLKLSQLR